MRDVSQERHARVSALHNETISCSCDSVNVNYIFEQLHHTIVLVFTNEQSMMTCLGSRGGMPSTCAREWCKLKEAIFFLGQRVIGVRGAHNAKIAHAIVR